MHCEIQRFERRGDGNLKITEEMKLSRALEKLEEMAKSERNTLQKMDGIKLKEIVIARNKQQIHIAEIDQLIRNTRAQLNRIREVG